MTKHNFYIITGGPGGGKTSLLESLASKGYNCIPETARQIIKERLSKGLTPRPDAKTFAREIFDQDWKNFISNSASDPSPNLDERMKIYNREALPLSILAINDCLKNILNPQVDNV